MIEPARIGFVYLVQEMDMSFWKLYMDYISDALGELAALLMPDCLKLGSCFEQWTARIAKSSNGLQKWSSWRVLRDAIDYSMFCVAAGS